jgi:predicted DNA-binding protein with PD1-like motif
MRTAFMDNTNPPGYPIRTLRGYHQLLSVQGTISSSGQRLHVTLSNSAGQAFGGQVLDYFVAHDTVEVIICELQGIVFFRSCPQQPPALTPQGLQGASRRVHARDAAAGAALK